MVKLIRLTSQDNGNFKANLDEGINVGADAKIALQNITFENSYPVLNIDSENGQVITNMDNTVFSNGTFAIPNKSYNKANYNNFFSDLQGSLNSTLSITNADSSENGGSAYRSFDVDYPSKNALSTDKTHVTMRYTPMISPFTMNDGTERDDQTTIFQISDGGNALGVNKGVDAPNRDNLWSPGPSSNLRDRYIFGASPEIMLSRGCGVFACQIENLGNVGNSNDNGFGIGLSYTQVKEIGTEAEGITPTMRDFEIRVKKNNDHYFTITPEFPNTEIDSGTAPFRFSSTGDLENDILVIEKVFNRIRLSVYNTSSPGGTTAFTPIEYEIPDEDLDKPLYPYLYVCGTLTGGAGVGCMVAMPFLTIDSNVQGNEDYEVTGNSQLVSAEKNFWEVLAEGASPTANFANIVPEVFNSVFDEPLDLNANPIISLSADVWDFLGFNIEGDGQVNYPNIPLPIENYDHSLTGRRNRMLRITLTSVKDFEVVLSDNFIVLLDSNPLFSYDASRTNYGNNSVDNPLIANRSRRQNILATIPVNNNASGIIEYQPNELTYIDLDSSVPQVIKNLRLRVLNKDFSPIETKGSSVMTLLIQS